jgi:hypothetical protein
VLTGPWPASRAFTVLLYGIEHRLAAPEGARGPTVTAAPPSGDKPGGCYTCRWFGERVDVAVWCAKPGGAHHRSQTHLGCAFWEREPGADDDLPTPKSPRPCIAAA